MARKKRADGRYVKKVTLPNGVIKYVYGKSAPELTEKERALLNEYNTGIILGDQTTVADWAGKWFKAYKAKLKYKTKESYLNAYNNHILPIIGGAKLKDLRQVHVREIMNACSAKSESLQTRVLMTLRQILASARENHLMVEDPTIGIKITRISAPDKAKFLTEDEYKQLLENVSEPRALVFCSLCLYAGLRRGEALGLQWTDISDGELKIQRGLTFEENQPTSDQSLKTKAAYRSVPIPSPLKAILDATPKKGLYILTDTTGKVMTKTSFRRMFAYAEKSVNFHIHPHMLRHTYATILYKAGIDLKTAQYLMGHEDIKTTANIYTHVEKSMAVKASSKIESFITGGQNGGQTPNNA